MYKIEATIFKPGSMPVRWLRYSDTPMTLNQCRKIITPPKNTGKFSVPIPKIDIKDFVCYEIE